jgi:putative hydrolase of the HAD superfamily
MNTKAIIFDLGGTLIEYQGLPLNWSSHYPQAFNHVIVSLGIRLNELQIQAAIAVLEKYNARLHPREIEYSSYHIFSEAISSWPLGQHSPHKIARTFYSFFQQHVNAYPDARRILPVLRNQSLKIGILTDLATGMPDETVKEDALSLHCPVNCFLTSAEVGFRKPNPAGYRKMAAELSVNPSECIFIGDEQKDIAGANNCGMVSVLIVRDDTQAKCGQTYTLSSLDKILSLLF